MFHAGNCQKRSLDHFRHAKRFPFGLTPKQAKTDDLSGGMYPHFSGPNFDCKAHETKPKAFENSFETATFQLLYSARLDDLGKKPRYKIRKSRSIKHSITCLLLPWRFQQQLCSDIGCLSWADWQSIRKRRGSTRQTSAIATRVALRSALSMFVAENTSPRAWQFASAPSGKPYVVNAPTTGVSTSYTRNLAAIAVASGLQVGLDIEDHEQAISPGMMSTYLAPRERESLARMPEGIRQSEFLKIWTVKEALIKLRGSSISEDITEIDICNCKVAKNLHITWKSSVIISRKISIHQYYKENIWLSIAIDLPDDNTIRDIGLNIYLAS